MTFADVVNSGLNLRNEITRVLEDINNGCRKYPNQPRHAGVLEPQKFVDHPLTLVDVDLVDGDSGEMVVDSAWGRKMIEFSVDDDVAEFCQMDLLEILY